MFRVRVSTIITSAAVAALLSACGGGSSSSTSAGIDTGALMLPSDGAPPADTLTIPAGQSVTQGGVVYSCPAGGPDCQVTATAGSDSATWTGGQPTAIRATWATETLATASGLGASSATPVFAASEADTVGTAVANETDGLPVLSTSLHRQWSPTSDVRLTDSGTFHVKSIRSDGSSNFTVRYVLDGSEAEVSFDFATHCTDAEGCEVTVGDVTHYFWQWWSDTLSGHDGWRYMDVFAYDRYSYDSQSASDRDNSAVYFVFGTRTEALPTAGEAIYRGHLQADLYDPDNPSGRDSWRMRGNVRLVANFDMSELQGRLYSLRVEVPRNASRTSWPTSSFELGDFAVNNGQFTATITGVDSDPSTAFDASVRGFMGSLLGEFYGPNAEEVGGVVAAERDEDGDSGVDRVLVGYFSAREIDSGNGVSDAFFTGIDSDHIEGTASTIVDVSAARLEAMADGTVRLTFNMEDGTSTTVEWGDSDHGAHPVYSRGNFVKKIDQTEYWLWSYTGAVGSAPLPEKDVFDHFDVYGWDYYEFVADASWPTTDYSAENSPKFSSGFLVDGQRTPVTSMPASGSASYSGVFEAFDVPTDDVPYPFDEIIQGSAMLMADFGAGSVTGLLDEISRESDGSAVDGAMTFNAMVSGNTLSASDLEGSGAFSGYANGSVKGAFYGPGAAEVGGVLEAVDTGNANLISGWFGGNRQ